MSLKQILRGLPLVPGVYRAMRTRWQGRKLAGLPINEIFGQIYRSNFWGSEASVSGTGSDAHQTARITAELPLIWRELGVRRVLDVPCGDFRWMRNVDLSGIDYLGGDIVPELIERNRSTYPGDGIKFTVLNLIEDPLPEADLVFCRDCLVHLSFADIWSALRTVAGSPARFFMATTFTGRSLNTDIRTGQWRPLNLEAAPFNLGPPERLLVEGCTEGEGSHADKSLGVWRVDSLRAWLGCYPIP